MYSLKRLLSTFIPTDLMPNKVATGSYQFKLYPQPKGAHHDLSGANRQAGVDGDAGEPAVIEQVR